MITRAAPVSIRLALVAVLIVRAAVAAASGCWDVHARWTESVLGAAESQVVIVGSNRGLKSLNHDVFGEWTYGSEHLSNTLHFLFQYHLRSQAGEMHVQGMSVEVPFTKFVLVGIDGTRASEALLDARVNAARYLAVRDAADYALSRGTEGTTLVASITGAGSELAASGLYRFPGGKTHLEALTPEQRTRFEAEILRHFGSHAKFHEALRDYYGVGIGSIEADAHFAAKLAGSGDYGSVVTFDFAHFAKAVLHGFGLRGEVAWALEGRSTDELTSVFKLVRANAGRSFDAWDPAFRELIGRQTELASSTGRVRAEELRAKLVDYVKQLNLTDFLQTPWLRVDPTARDRFNAFASPSGVLFLDVRGLGARGLTAIHETLPRLADLTTRVTELIDRDGLGVDVEISRELDATFGELRTVRETILTPANALLEQVRAEAAAAMERAGLKPDDFVLWTSGDDMLAVFRLPEGSTTSPRELAQKLASDPTLKGRVRLAVEASRGAERLSLEDARDGVGVSADALKLVEGLSLPYEIFVERLAPEGGRQRLVVTRADGSAVPAADAARITAALPEWKLESP
jgi:hypothetical protein